MFGSAADTTILNGGVQDVIAGGTASGTTGCRARRHPVRRRFGESGTTLSGGTEVVFASDTSASILNPAAAQDVVAGGTAIRTAR